MSRRDSAERFRPSRRRSAQAAEEPGDGRRFARLPVVVAALLAAALLGFLIYRYSVTSALLEASPQLAATVAPEHPDVILALAFDELQLSGDPSAATEADALAAFRRAPLSEVPMLIAARRAVDREDGARAERLVSEAARRNPRSRYALLLKLDQQVRSGRAAEAAGTMAVLTRSFPDAGPLLTAQLALMAANPETRGAVREVMATDPQLRAAVLEQLARQGADADTILDLAGQPEGGTPAWQRILLERLVDRGDVAEAQRVWQRLSGVRPPDPPGIYDPDFAGLPGAPPFNWNLETSGEGFAERADRGLHGEYYGRGNARMASQLLVLPPGTYRLSFTADGRAESEDGKIAMTVSCHPGTLTGLEIPITDVGGSPSEFEAEFTVPASGCPGQWLRVEGSVSEFPKDQQVTIRQLRIERVSG